MNDYRIWLAGAPGAGRSTLIRSLGGDAGCRYRDARRAEMVLSTREFKARVRIERLDEEAPHRHSAGEFNVPSGLLVLVNHSGAAPGRALEQGLNQARQALAGVPVVVAVTHLDGAGIEGLNRYFDYLGERELEYRVFPVDTRNRLQARLLVEEMALTLSGECCLSA